MIRRQRVPETRVQRRGEELRNERSANLSLEVRVKGETEIVSGASFTNGFDVDEITKIGWSQIYGEVIDKLILYALFDLEPVKRSECRTDV